MRRLALLFLWVVTSSFFLSLSFSQSHSYNSQSQSYNNLYSFPYTAQLRRWFEDSFHDRCDKYPFVHQFVRLMEGEGEETTTSSSATASAEEKNKKRKQKRRQLMYVYQEPRLKNGGLGDRIGGLISAVTLALRFNRTLVLRESNGMHEIFRPYHPTDIVVDDKHVPKFRWDNFKEWSDYDQENADHDETEYDLWDCINNVGNRNDHCSMVSGDVSQPIILYRSNRAYLCYYHNNPTSVAWKQMKELLGIKEDDNSTGGLDLYEVGGCMLRLALWPTEQLWKDVDKVYHEYGKLIHFDELYANFSKSSTVTPLSLNETDTHNSMHRINPLFYQVGLHFRCGDHNYIGRGGHSEDACVYTPEKGLDMVNNIFTIGNPVGLGMCAKESIHNHTHRLIEHHQTLVTENTWPLDRKSSISNQPQFMLVFIASDNELAGKQMGSVISAPFTLYSPKGCHIELDPSKECHTLTVVQWFVLAMSNIVVTQSLPDGQPPSSFSRYAGLYGLKHDPFLNGRDCHSSLTNKELQVFPQSNWFC